MWVKLLVIVGAVFMFSCRETNTIDVEKLTKTCAALNEKECNASAKICYFNKINSNCHAKAALLVTKIAATNDALLAITKDGYLFQNPLTDAPTVSKKIKDLSSTNDYYCVIDDTDILSCHGSKNVPVVPANTKAKQVSVGSKDNLCYLSDKDTIECIGKNAANPRLGVGTTVDPLTAGKLKDIQIDLSNETFTNIKAGYDHACGVRQQAKELTCISHDPLPANHMDALFLLPNNKTSVALGVRATYFFYGQELPGFQKRSSSNFTDTTKFVAQGTKSNFVDVAKKHITNMSVFVDDKTSDVICVLADKKVYCSAIDPDDADRIDLTALTPEDATSVHLSSEIVCAIESSNRLHCAHIYGQNNDKRITGFNFTAE